MFGALVRAAERWRGLRFTEFELRQIAAVRKDLDAEYEATRSDKASQTRVSSRSALFPALQRDPIPPARVKAVIGGEALQRSLFGRAEGEVGGVLHWGALSGLAREREGAERVPP